MIEDFENVCGEAPKDTENLNFQVSDPNFVFENDPSYQTIVLYDRDGNVVNVNSWIECANYVEGGWTNGLITSSNSEMYYFLFLTGLLLSLLGYRFLQKKYVKK